MPKNYYIILGIPADSSHSDIKSAYRRLAKEYHPDYYAESNSPFQAIQEAYSVLSDPSQRKQYDDSLSVLRARKGQRSEAIQRGFSRVKTEPLVPEPHQAEPLTPRAADISRSMASGLESLLGDFFNTASSSWAYDRGRNDYEDMEVLLTADQAQRGGHIRVHLPVQVRCPSCQGWAGCGLQECWRCFGTGFLRGEVPLFLNYPPGIPDNHVVEFPLSRYGFAGNALKVRFMVADSPR